MRAKNIILAMAFAVAGIMPLAAQEYGSDKKVRKAWEIGVGGSVMQFNRIQLTNFTQMADGSYNYDLGVRNSVFGVNIYAAKELNPYFYLDMQGTVGFTTEDVNGKDKNRTLFMVGPGIQWRLGEYFNSKYIEPYVRVGANYMHKNFSLNYSGFEGMPEEQMNWILSNKQNKDGRDKNNMFTASAGLGVNMWLCDGFGIGLQGDYVIMPYKDVANSLEGTVRVMWRLGGKSKKPVVSEPRHIEVEKIVHVEKIVEVPVIEYVETVVEKEGRVKLQYLFNNIFFEYDKAQLTAETEKVMDEIAEILKDNLSYNYLITGYTDAVGSSEYNLNLSSARAKAVVTALEKRGVPSNILKSVGVGKKVAHMTPNSPATVRAGDRKVMIEIITNQGYWKNLPANR